MQNTENVKCVCSSNSKWGCSSLTSVSTVSVIINILAFPCHISGKSISFISRFSLPPHKPPSWYHSPLAMEFSRGGEKLLCQQQSQVASCKTVVGLQESLLLKSWHAPPPSPTPTRHMLASIQPYTRGLTHPLDICHTPPTIHQFFFSQLYSTTNNISSVVVMWNFIL